MGKEGEWPVLVSVQIEPKGLGQLAEQGRLMEFVNAFSSLAAAQIKSQLVEHLVEAGPDQAVDMHMGFKLVRDYGTGPFPWPPRWDAIDRLGHR